MSFFSLLGSLILGPLRLLFEILFQAAYRVVEHPGAAIVFLSLGMNLLVLPLYRRADRLQEEARDAEARLRPGVTHIKKTFSGNERMMMLQTYYRQNHYSPANSLHGSISLLLEIPFFLAAYQFLSELPVLQGVSFGPIADLSRPDGLLSVGGLTVNLLPVLMTLINFVASAVYAKGFPLKTKVQLYGIAVVFLVFLYASPSGLVFYWTLNNLFSLVKNLCYRLSAVKKLQRGLSALGSRIRGRLPARFRNREFRPDRRRFFAGALFLTALTGLLIPSAYIAASPQEFVDMTLFFHPLWYVANTFCLAAGTFFLWFGVFYWLAGPKGKVRFERLLWLLSLVCVTDYMFFGKKLGVISAALKYESSMVFVRSERMLNAGVLLLLLIAGLWAVHRFRNLPKRVLPVAAAAVLVMSGIHMAGIGSSIAELNAGEGGAAPSFTLSREGKNVVVLLLDRALGEDLPYLLQEDPGLKETFDGFTYYSNVISFGGHTNMAAPALMGGYEYTPVEMNRRGGELLKDKHNEALKVMPVLFAEHGFDVEVFDAPYANYQWIPDLSIYEDHPGIRARTVKGYYGSEAGKQKTIDTALRNFFLFSVMKTLPLDLQPDLYDEGQYLSSEGKQTQQREGVSRAHGLTASSVESYEVLTHLPEMTRIEETGDHYLFFYSDFTHDPMLLQEPACVPAEEVDNTAYDAAHADRFTADGRRLAVTTGWQMAHYQTNLADLRQVGAWLDHLREAGAYDNTRIILAADHGYYLYQSEDLIHREDGKRDLDIGNYFPLLMVKDFDSHGFTASDTFMTNADVPVLAAEGVIEGARNPFTGKPLTSDEKTAHDQLILTGRAYNVNKNNGTAFQASTWAAVTGDIWDRDDWEFLDEEAVLTEHRIPQQEEGR